MYRKRKSFFHNKRCYLCKSRAKFFRYYKGKSYYLCSSEECNYKNIVTTGWFVMNQIVREEEHAKV